MYKNHVPLIATAARDNPKLFVEAAMFAVLSARTQFITVPAQMLELDLRGDRAKCLWAWKVDAYQYLTEHGRRLHAAICDIPVNDPEQALRTICTIPGLGIVKGAFVLQMLGYDVACLDVRNIVREGRDPRAYRTDGVKTGAAFNRKVARYVADTGGKAQFYWDAWCHDVAETYKKSAHQISEMHTCFLTAKYLKPSAQSIDWAMVLKRRDAAQPAPF